MLKRGSAKKKTPSLVVSGKAQCFPRLFSKKDLSPGKNEDQKLTRKERNLPRNHGITGGRGGGGKKGGKSPRTSMSFKLKKRERR